MKKKVLGIVLATAMCASLMVGCGGSSESASNTDNKETTAEATPATEEAAAEVDTAVIDELKEKYGADVFEANADYDVYTVVEYTIENAGATFAATVSKKSDNSEYYIQCLFYGDEQVVKFDGEKVTEDKTGFMETDTPFIVEAAEAQNVWVPIQ